MAYSLSKIQITEAHIREIVTSQFGSRYALSAFTELKEGMFNTAVLLELSDGSKWVLKAAPPPGVTVLTYEHDIMRAEVEAMRLVRRQAGVPVPNILAYDDSCRCLPSSYFIMDLLPGIPFNRLRDTLPQAAQAQVEREMGRLTRQMASIKGTAYGYWARPEPAGVSWRECFIHMLQGVLADGMAINVRLPLPYGDIFHLAERHFDALNAVREPRLVHWDMWDGNVFVDPQTLRVTGLIDFERVLWGDPLMEAIFGHPSPDTEYVRGYGEPLFQSPSEYQRRALYNTYLFLIMVIECYYRQFDNHRQEDWARARLEETLAWLSGEGK